MFSGFASATDIYRLCAIAVALSLAACATAPVGPVEPLQSPNDDYSYRLLELDNGMQVLVQARVGLYEPRGEYQLVADKMEEAGEGLLRRKFEELKAKLDTEGLFDPDRKRPIPAFPAQIGIVTSPTAASPRCSWRRRASPCRSAPGWDASAS